MKAGSKFEMKFVAKMMKSWYSFIAMSMTERVWFTLTSVALAAAQDGISFIEKDDAARFLSSFKDLADVLWRFADVFGFDIGIVDDDDLAPQMLGDGMCCHRLARARLAVEVDADALGIFVRLFESPLFKDDLAVLGIVGSVQNLLTNARRQDHVIKRVLRLFGCKGIGRLFLRFVFLRRQRRRRLCLRGDALSQTHKNTSMKSFCLICS